MTQGAASKVSLKEYNGYKKVESIKLSYTEVSRQGFGSGAINFLMSRTKEGFNYDASRSNDTLFVFDNAFNDYDFYCPTIQWPAAFLR